MSVQDLTVLAFNEIAWIPAGIKSPVVPVLNSGYSSLGKQYNVKYDFVCMTLARDITVDILRASFPAGGLNTNTYPGICSDGMNSKGLTISLQWQTATTEWPEYSGTGPAVDQLDLVQYVLASFSSMAEVMAALEGGLQVV